MNTFDEILAQVRELVQREGRVAYRVLKRRFDIDDEYVEDLKADLIDAKRVAIDEDSKVLVWVGASPVSSSKFQVSSSLQPPTPQILNSELQSSQSPDAGHRTSDAGQAAAERRQLTVLFCDLVDSTALSAQLDPEEYREVVRSYQHTNAEIIERYSGHIAQYLGDGLLVYFGYPVAHEDDAARAVRAGLEIIAAIEEKVLSLPVEQAFSLYAARMAAPLEGQGEGTTGKQLRVRIGIHTGLVVVGEIGGGTRHEQLALGETPNLAARLQSLAEPNTVIISAATQRLVEGQFESQPFGSHRLKGFTTPVAVYHVQSERQSVSPLAGRTTLTPLVGREQEVGLLLDRWEQTKEGRGQVVLLCGEPGIGKSRLAYTLREHVTREGSLLFEARCSPYHQHSALYPLIDVLQRTLLFTRQDTDAEKVTKLERVLALYELQPAVPLFAALLSLPTPSSYPPLTFTPQKQKERTLGALLQLLGAQAERQATVLVWEDVHWADPSSLEFLSLLIEQLPTTKLMLVLTFRPEFTPPWKPRSHISQLVLNRLGKRQVEVMIEKAAGQGLSAEIVEQIRLKTDGVPLFVEELTKSVLESVASRESKESRESPHRTPLQFAIPATLQEALLARLDRLSEARQVAQLGATLGREFSYELLQAVTPLKKTELQEVLSKLVEAEILYQRGIGEQARYFFKHALIQDTAYQSLLKSTRQQYHTQIAQVLEEQFPHTKESQPELLAHHYTEANLTAQAIPYWQRAGQNTAQRSANVEAISHLTKGLELLMTLPDTPARAQQELTLQLALGAPLIAIKGYAAQEVEQAYTRAQELCSLAGETAQLFSVLVGLRAFHAMAGRLAQAHDIGEQLLILAQRTQEPGLLLEAHWQHGNTLCWAGEFAAAHEHLERALALYDPVHHRKHATLYGQDTEVASLSHVAMGLWFRGYPEQALQKAEQALTRGRECAHLFSIGYAHVCRTYIHLFRQEEHNVQQWAEAAIALAREHGFPFWATIGRIELGWALTKQGKGEEGIEHLREGCNAWRTTGNGTFFLGWLAEAYGDLGQPTEGLAELAEGLARAKKTGERFYEAELYRLKGELTLQQFKVQGSKSQTVQSPEVEAEECFLRAIEIAQKQQAKSLELRATASLARLWQQQALRQSAKSEERTAGNAEEISRNTNHATRVKLAEAHKLLSEVYHWFTEGFDTKDLREAKALIAELSD